MMATIQTESSSSGGPTVPAKIFCGGLSDVTTNASLRTHFSPYGEIVDSVVLTEKTTGRSRGFGFITFASEESVDAVLSSPQIVDGKEIDCKRAVPRGVIQANETEDSTENNQTSNSNTSNAVITNVNSSGTSGNGSANNSSNATGRSHMGNSSGSSGGFSATKIFVGGLPQSCTDEKLRDHFGKYGTIKNLSVMVDRDTNRHRGFGFVEYESPDAVEEVMRHYYDHKIDNKWVECKKALPREIMAGNSNQNNIGGHGGGSMGSSRVRANPGITAGSAAANSSYADYYRNPYLPVHAGGVPSQQIYGRYGRHDPRYMYAGYASGYSSNIYTGGYGQIPQMHHTAAPGPPSSNGMGVSMPSVIPTLGSHFGEVSSEQTGNLQVQAAGQTNNSNSSLNASSNSSSTANPNSGNFENQDGYISEQQGMPDSNLHSYHHPTASVAAAPATAPSAAHPSRPGMPPHVYAPNMVRPGPYAQGRYAPSGALPYSVPGTVPTHGRMRGMY
ncbi:heterogeneous nuclear ribonucleoprotein 1-like [Cryptosporidium felis]|nr:heterogeneous nuclear ribonucleoprotein 1-like [Cryptosporidium felis]